MTEHITVVIPARNRCRLLQRTLGTVFAQQGADFDVVVVDEGSTDDTPEMLERLPYDRLTVLRHEQAKGVPAARNAGVAAATGQWVAFVDDDDIWSPGKLRPQLAAAEETPGRTGRAPERSGSTNSWNCAVVRRHPWPRPSPTPCLPNVIPGGASGVLARTDLVRQVGGFDVALSNLADYDLWIRLGLAAPFGRGRSAVSGLSRGCIRHGTQRASLRARAGLHRAEVLDGTTSPTA